MKKISLLLSIASSIFITTLSVADTVAPPDQARQRLNTFFTTVNSLQGNFTQQVYSKKNKLIQNSTGSIYLRRPGLFRWVYKTPDPQTIVSDGKNIWIYDEDLEQVTIKPMKRALSSSPISILTHKQSPDAEFVVKKMKSSAGNLDWFKLTPRKASRDFKYLEVGIDKRTMRQMIMYDQLGQKTVVQLNVQLNQPIKGSTFFFKIPKGVDVIGTAL